jgi:hypothetical protein
MGVTVIKWIVFKFNTEKGLPATVYLGKTSGELPKF